MIKLVFIIIHYEKTALTKKAIDSLSPYLDNTTKIIVVDNGSTKEPISSVQQEYQHVDFIILDSNTGFAEGNNHAIRYAVQTYSPQYFFLLNNDARLIAGNIHDCINVMEESPKIGIIGPKILDAHTGKIWSAGGELHIARALYTNRGLGQNDAAEFHAPRNVDFVSGCAMLIRRQLIETIGSFDPVYFAYIEDVDFCYRARMRGFTVYYYPYLIVEHDISQSSGGEYSAFASFYRWRNRLIFMHKHAPQRQRRIFMWLLFPLIMLRDVVRYLVMLRWHAAGSLFKGLWDSIRISYEKH